MCLFETTFAHFFLPKSQKYATMQFLAKKDENGILLKSRNAAAKRIQFYYRRYRCGFTGMMRKRKANSTKLQKVKSVVKGTMALLVIPKMENHQILQTNTKSLPKVEPASSAAICVDWPGVDTNSILFTLEDKEESEVAVQRLQVENADEYQNVLSFAFLTTSNMKAKLNGVDGTIVVPWYKQWMAKLLFVHHNGNKMNLVGNSYSSSDDIRKRMGLNGDGDRMFAKLRSEMCMPLVKMFGYVLCSVFRQLFQGIYVDIKSMKTLKQELKDNVVLLPSHKSHLDYLIMSFVCFAYDIPMPRIAAGVNLNLPVIGKLLRYNGSFFIKRSFKGDDRYQNILQFYVHELIRDGCPLEIFIEGGRSRHGRLCIPKLGFLSMLSTIVNESSELDYLNVVPISIDYDRVLEVPDYASHLIGRPKTQESLFGLLQSAYTVLKAKCGFVYIRFGASVSLSPNSTTSISTFGQKITSGIQSSATISSTVLVSSCLLAFAKLDFISMPTLVHYVQILHSDLSSRGIHVANFGDAASITTHGLGMLPSQILYKTINDVVFVKVQQCSTCQWQDATTKLELSFYRNQLLHIYAMESIFSIVILHITKSISTNSTFPISQAMHIIHQLSQFTQQLGNPSSNDLESKFLHRILLCPFLHSIGHSITLVHSPQLDPFEYTFLPSLLSPSIDSIWFLLQSLQLLPDFSKPISKLIFNAQSIASTYILNSNLRYTSESLSIDSLQASVRYCIQLKLLLPSNQQQSKVSTSQQYKVSTKQQIRLLAQLFSNLTK